MAIPYQLTLEEIARTALRGAGQPAPSQGMIQEAKSIFFAQVKNDIKAKASTHDLLEVTEITLTTRGVRSIAQPTKAHKVKSALLLTGPTGYRGTAQAGASGSITLASTMSAADNAILGYPIVTLSGTGSLQMRHITGYTQSTKVATISPAWTTTPDNTTTYLVVDAQREMLRSFKQELNYSQYGFVGEGMPCAGSLEGEQLWFDLPPDNQYPVLWTYYIDIDQLDESDTTMQKILREWLNVIMEGISVKAMGVYDDVRYNDRIMVYKFMLDALSHEALRTEQMVPYDP